MRAKPQRDRTDTQTHCAQRYQAERTPTLVLAGTDYGMGSSRDWAAKGTYLLGIRVVIAGAGGYGCEVGAVLAELGPAPARPRWQCAGRWRDRCRCLPR